MQQTQSRSGRSFNDHDFLDPEERNACKTRALTGMISVMETWLPAGTSLCRLGHSDMPSVTVDAGWWIVEEDFNALVTEARRDGSSGREVRNIRRHMKEALVLLPRFGRADTLIRVTLLQPARAWTGKGLDVDQFEQTKIRSPAGSDWLWQLYIPGLSVEHPVGSRKWHLTPVYRDVMGKPRAMPLTSCFRGMK